MISLESHIFFSLDGVHPVTAIACFCFRIAVVMVSFREFGGDSRNRYEGLLKGEFGPWECSLG